MSVANCRYSLHSLISSMCACHCVLLVLKCVRVCASCGTCRIYISVSSSIRRSTSPRGWMVRSGSAMEEPSKARSDSGPSQVFCLTDGYSRYRCLRQSLAELDQITLYMPYACCLKALFGEGVSSCRYTNMRCSQASLRR